MTDHLRVIGSRRYGTLSPLRYPGGKAALAGFFADIIHALNITDACYIEPYAGGAGAGIALLLNRVVQHLVINDIDPAVHAFWKSVIDNNSEFVKLVSTTPLTINEWHRQRTIYRTKNEDDILNLGFAFFYLNRTNRSGILNAGAIGGQQQEGKYKIDARFNRSALIERLTTIGHLASQITVSDSDGRTVIQQHANDEQTFMYIDPPYVQAGSKLYLNAFDGRDHQALSTIVKAVDRAHWLVTYDTSPLIEKLYQDQFQCRLELTYAARHPGKAEELLVASPSVAKAIKAVQAVSQEAPAANA